MKNLISIILFLSLSACTDKQLRENIEQQKTVIINQVLEDMDSELPSGPIKIELWSKGKIVASDTSIERDWKKNLNTSLNEVFSKIEPNKDMLAIICLIQKIDDTPVSSQKRFRNSDRGKAGLLVKNDSNIQRIYCPQYSIAKNTKLNKLRDRLLAEHQKSKLHKFEAIELVYPVNAPHKISKLSRGTIIEQLSDVTHGRIKESNDLMAQWLVNNLKESGQMQYKYWPSTNKYSEQNNMIRQWMATLALSRSYKKNTSDKLKRKIDKNIKFNLKNFYKQDGSVGYIEYNKKVKLGAIALAGLAILESPVKTKYQKELTSLKKMTVKLWNQDGSFITFYKPAHRTDGNNFYPGEALYFWSYLLKNQFDQDLYNKFMASVEYYQKWHAKNRNPAFIPWHVQAYYNVYKIKPSKNLKTAIFKMSDWLIENMQQWEETRQPEFKGRFYSSRVDYGPPHSSSTGVYLEGLIDSFALARQLEDSKRASKYKLSILRGLRSVLQNQFNKPEELYYIDHPVRVFGGMRTTVYNNEIRVDNTQHNYMALIKILERFKTTDFMPSQHNYSNKKLRNLAFSNKNLTGSQFVATRGFALKFKDTDLTDSNMQGFYCRFCSFENVNLSGVDLTKAVFIQPKFSKIKLDNGTRLPSSIVIKDQINVDSRSLN